MLSDGGEDVVAGVRVAILVEDEVVVLVGAVLVDELRVVAKVSEVSAVIEGDEVSIVPVRVSGSIQK